MLKIIWTDAEWRLVANAYFAGVRAKTGVPRITRVVQAQLQLPVGRRRPVEHGSCTGMVSRFLTLRASGSDVGLNAEQTKLRIVEMIDTLSDEDRTDVFGKYCTYCGTNDSGCQCWNDE